MAVNNQLEKEIDKQTTTQWAISSLASGGLGDGAGVVFFEFDLVNLTTGRAHMLKVDAAGMTLGPLPFSASLTSSGYFSFTTRRPVNFRDFDGDGAQLFDASGVVRSVTKLVISEGLPVSGVTAVTQPPNHLATVWIDGGWGLSTPGVDVLIGRITVAFGLGSPAGDLDVELIPSIAPKLEDEDLPVRVIREAREDALDFDVAGDALFDFDRSEIKPAAAKVLDGVGKGIRSRRPKRVIIYGYTDSIGDEKYNDDLSDRRAKAVQRWLASKNYLKGAAVEAAGRGTDNPAVDNQDTSNTPANRERQRENRRVEILLFRR